ncbi:GIY-YIG nuclease family protein [Chitinophaga sp. NPDC101104]|uniref:GIY-YIG nuclease family protein n=1 Tax=Chitinophaga sp. NPDC101104 TaxID=3390561 RepID=UPI003D074757
MKIKASWGTPMKLKSNLKENRIYWADTDKIPGKPGCYFFYNQHGNNIRIMYIGKAQNLKKRVEQQFLRNVPLMVGMSNFLKGSKMLMFCEMEGKADKRLDILESQLIKAATLEGHVLLNIKGTKKIIKHVIEFTKTNRSSNQVFKKYMNVLS